MEWARAKFCCKDFIFFSAVFVPLKHLCCEIGLSVICRSFYVIVFVKLFHILLQRFPAFFLFGLFTLVDEGLADVIVFVFIDRSHCLYVIQPLFIVHVNRKKVIVYQLYSFLERDFDLIDVVFSRDGP